MATWASASDAPKVSGRYQCIVEHGQRTKYKLCTVRYDADARRWRTMYIADAVRYWMPIPELPEGIILYADDDGGKD